MKQRTFIVTNKLGLPTRSAAALVHVVKTSRSRVWVEKGGEKRDARKIVDLLNLATPCGSEITITVEGDDEDTVMQRISDLMDAARS